MRVVNGLLTSSAKAFVAVGLLVAGLSVFLEVPLGAAVAVAAADVADVGAEAFVSLTGRPNRAARAFFFSASASRAAAVGAAGMGTDTLGAAVAVGGGWALAGALGGLEGMVATGVGAGAAGFSSTGTCSGWAGTVDAGTASYCYGPKRYFSQRRMGLE